jgi:zinc transporter 1/2/3
MQDIWFKLLAILIIIATGMIFGMFPRRIGLSPQGKRWLALGNAFAGGVFLGAGLIHMLPDAIKNLGVFGVGSGYPSAFLICGIGFLSVLFLEKVVLRGQGEDTLAENRQSFPIVLFLILSVHSLIAGAAMGLETDFVTSIAIFIAIIAHKGTAAFALGVELATEQVPEKRHVRTIALFSCMTPLGIILGTVFASLFAGETAVITEGLFDGLAAGTFIYISTLEIIEETFEVKLDQWQKFLLICTCFGFMALIAVWA